MSLMEFPTTRDEAFRWADMPALEAARALPSTTAPIPEPILTDAVRLVFVDSFLVDEPAGLGIAATTLASDHPLARHAAGQGYAITLPPRSVTRIEIVRANAGGDSHTPISITIGEDAVLTLVETFTGAGWTNTLTRFDLGTGARAMRAVRIVQDAGFVSTRDEVTIARAASFVSVALGATAAGTRLDAALTLNGDGAYAELGGALLTRGDQRQECAVRVRHAAPNGQSHQLWRAVAADRSTASLVAAVEVARDAQKTDGEQSLRGLLLQRSATVNLKPELEIFADDVKCAHGATVGELDARALFYMQSRGIPAARAKALLTRAFVADALDRIADQAVREVFAADADAWLEQAL
ncbi:MULTISPECIES: SufD family Fe-S cluster assembly protein [unclassified Sphingomonas]|jgi:Fe-S cluster assembly protein SufD|uniref:SufB/SufD family protein n=1 Tax=unclassified Sphingomonas TaxID=196159 RepID=UPI000E100F48|nr:MULTISPECIES: SufD family Fe-S cluster assembly protein [unclassified Sphingomonas]AXJ95943.1 SufD family Fe-S cluster assembly protein [Sphingomonas sp. FARSPH]